MGRYPWGWADPNRCSAWGFGASGAFPPWGRRGRFFGSGEVRIAILSLLSDGPKHGYELMKELESRSGGSYRVSAGTMYPSLQQLEDEGMIVSEQKNGKRVYQLTDLGKQELAREGHTADEIWRRASRWGDWAQWMGPEVAVISGPLGALLKASFRAMKNSSNAAQREKIQEILDRALRDIEAIVP
ncbi:MAG TPA: PadR family transcriptional regulator [Bryobacteraceae bacterium]|nr:PadR family transcriptional regulator [Bryobacteraceae bacterium]